MKKILTLLFLITFSISYSQSFSVSLPNELIKVKELKADGLLATCLQHEIDHLNGKLFIDYLSRLKRDSVIRKFTKIARHEKSDSL